MADKLSGHPEDTEALVYLQQYLDTVSHFHFFRLSVSLHIVLAHFPSVYYPAGIDYQPMQFYLT